MVNILAKSLCLALVFMAGTPASGMAHFSTEMGSFYNGVLHPITDLAVIVSIFGAGIWAAQQKTGQAGRMILLYVLTIPAGAYLGFQVTGGVKVVTLLSVILTGILTFLETRPPMGMAAGLIVLLSLGFGYVNTAEVSHQLDRPLLYTAGLCTGGGLSVLYISGFLLSRKSAKKYPFMRAAGGLTAGIGLLILGSGAIT